MSTQLSQSHADSQAATGGGYTLMTAENYAYAELALLREICTREFSLQQRLVLYVILKFSFGRCRGKAYLPSLRAFFDTCGVARYHVLVALRELKNLRIIGEDPPCCYGFNVIVANWGVDLRVAGDRMDEQLYFDDASLSDALREVFVQNSKNDILRSVSILSAREQGATLFFRPETDSTARGAHLPAGFVEGTAPMRQEPVSTDGQSRLAQPTAITVLASDCPPRPAGSQEISARERTPGVPDSGTVGVFAGVPESGTPPVPESGTLWKKLKADAGLLDAVPESGTPCKGFPPCTPLPKRLTVERSTLNAQGQSIENGLGPEPVRAVSRQEERDLMKLIEEFVGEQDMADNGGIFRVRWVRNGNLVRRGWTMKEVIEEQVRHGMMLVKTSAKPPFSKNAGAWLMRMLCLAAGVEQSSDMPKGPKPL